MSEQRTDETTGTIDRNPRANDERAATARNDDDWLPSTALPTPAPQHGWAFRWVRTSTFGHADNTNVSRRMREGWVPVKAEDHLELQLVSDLGSRFKGGLEVGGLLLCKAPIEQIKKRQAYQAKKAEQQMESVDNNYMRENDPRMPLLQPERRTRTQFGRG